MLELPLKGTALMTSGQSRMPSAHSHHTEENA